jgi:hypothetical protein
MIRFHATHEDEARAKVAPGHVITRTRGWFRLGGAQYLFHCTCGWQGQRNGCGAGKSNAPAERHAREVAS